MESDPNPFEKIKIITMRDIFCAIGEVVLGVMEKVQPPHYLGYQGMFRPGYTHPLDTPIEPVADWGEKQNGIES